MYVRRKRHQRQPAFACFCPMAFYLYFFIFLFLSFCRSASSSSCHCLNFFLLFIFPLALSLPIATSFVVVVDRKSDFCTVSYRDEEFVAWRREEPPPFNGPDRPRGINPVVKQNGEHRSQHTSQQKDGPISRRKRRRKTHQPIRGPSDTAVYNTAGLSCSNTH